jgi:hypothetical protein
MEGNLSFATDDHELGVKIKEWSDGEDRFTAPRSIADRKTEDTPTLIERIKMWEVAEEALFAFPAEAAEEELLERDSVFFDEAVDDEDVGDGAAEILRQEQEMLGELPLPGTLEHEKDRRKKWLTLPRPARAAIRRMRTQFGHCPKAPLYEILKAAKCLREYPDSCEDFRCEPCERTQHLPKQTREVALPKPYVFNHSVGFDINFFGDCDGGTYVLTNIVDVGAGFQIECYLRVGQGTPKSLECLDAFVQYWVSWAGYPKGIVSDRGLNNRGVFCEELPAAGVICASVD